MSWSVPGYVADELIGFGATGEVWRGRDTATGELVALKRLRTVDPQNTARLRREAALLAGLDHPHLLRLRESVRSGDEWVLVLEYAAGGSLAALLRGRGRLRPGEVVTAIAPLAAALAYAHGEGLVHGDVTPSNVLLTADGRPWLADLGIARIGGEGGPVHATPEYADPVVARGSAPGAASDVFAVAAVAFHALSGVPPWSAPTAEETLFLAASGERADLRELVPDLPPAMTETIERALSADPAARGTAAEFALDLRHSCPPEPIELPGPVPTTVPESARPAAMTHAVRSRHSAPAVTGKAARELWSPLARLGKVLRNPGLRAAVLAVVSIAVAVRLGVAWAGSDTHSTEAQDAPAAVAAASTGGSSPAGPSPSSAPSSGTSSASPSGPSNEAGSSWRQVLTGLDDRRAAAFAAADPGPLQEVYVPGSAALASDTAQIATLSRKALSAHGVRHDVRSVRAVDTDAGRAVLLVEESLQSYEVRQGDSAQQQPGAPARRYRITLQKVDGGWRIQQLSQA